MIRVLYSVFDFFYNSGTGSPTPTSYDLELIVKGDMGKIKERKKEKYMNIKIATLFQIIFFIHQFQSLSALDGQLVHLPEIISP